MEVALSTPLEEWKPGPITTLYLGRNIPRQCSTFRTIPANYRQWVLEDQYDRVAPLAGRGMGGEAVGALAHDFRLESCATLV
jgi:hypothetical protein